MGSNFAPQNNQVVPNSPSVQMMPSPQTAGQPVNNPNMPIQVSKVYKTLSGVYIVYQEVVK